MDRKWYHVCWPRLTAKRVEPVVSISWASCNLVTFTAVQYSNVDEWKLFGDLDWPLNASRRFVSISWASCFIYNCDDGAAADTNCIVSTCRSVVVTSWNRVERCRTQELDRVPIDLGMRREYLEFPGHGRTRWPHVGHFWLIWDVRLQLRCGYPLSCRLSGILNERRFDFISYLILIKVSYLKQIARVNIRGRPCKNFPHTPCNIWWLFLILRMCAHVEGPKIWGTLGPALLCDPKKHANPHICYHTKYGRSRSNRLGVGRGPQNLRDAGAPPLWMGHG